MMMRLALVLLLCLGTVQAQKAKMTQASLDIRSWDNQEGDRDRLGERAYNLMRLATWSVTFDKDIKVKKGSDPSKSLNEFRNFDLPHPWWTESLMQVGMAGINLQFKCQMDAARTGGTAGTLTEQSFSTKRSAMTEEDFPVDWLVMLPAASNAFARWFQKILRGLQIFPASDVWSTNILNFGSVAALAQWDTPDCSGGMPPGCGSTDMADKKKPGQHWHINLETYDFSSCKAEIVASTATDEWIIVDAATDQPLDAQIIDAPLMLTPCSPEGLAEVGPKLETVITALASSESETAFHMVDRSFSQLYSMDGWAGCQQKVDSMVTLVQTQEPKPLNRECTESEEINCEDSQRNSDDRCPFNQAWLDDPCCNPAKAFDMCCAPRDTTVSATIIDSFTFANGNCSASRQSEVTNAMNKFQAAIALRNNGLSGCTAKREAETGSDNRDDQMAFMSTCHTKIWNQLTKTGGDTCTSDDDCFTSCNENESPARCARPFMDTERAWIKCSLYEMDGTMNNYFRESLGLTSANDENDVYNKMLELYGVYDCIGESGWQGGGCWADVSESTCNSGGWDVRWEESSPFAAQGYKCRLRNFYLDEGDYGDQNKQSPCLGECQCKTKVEEKFTGQDGKFELFRNVYRHQWNETTQSSERVVIAAGSKAISVYFTIWPEPRHPRSLASELL